MVPPWAKTFKFVDAHYDDADDADATDVGGRRLRQGRAAGPADAVPGDGEGGDQLTGAQWGRHVL